MKERQGGLGGVCCVGGLAEDLSGQFLFACGPLLPPLRGNQSPRHKVVVTQHDVLSCCRETRAGEV